MFIKFDYIFFIILITIIFFRKLNQNNSIVINKISKTLSKLIYFTLKIINNI